MPSIHVSNIEIIYIFCLLFPLCDCNIFFNLFGTNLSAVVTIIRAPQAEWCCLQWIHLYQRNFDLTTKCIDKPASKLLAGCENQTCLRIQKLMGVPSLAKLQAQSFLTMAVSSALLGFWCGLPGLNKNNQIPYVGLPKHEINSSPNFKKTN